MPMKRIDSHQHFWYYEPVKDSWMTDDMELIKKDFMPTDLLPVLEELGFEGCITVQVAQTEAETEFLLKLAGDYSFIKGIVGWVHLKAIDIEAKLQKLSSNRKLKGFRHVLQTEPDDKYMLDDDFKRGIKALRKHGFTYDILIYPRHIKYATEMVSKFPEQAFVIDHLAKPLIKTQEIKEWEDDIRRIAQMPHVYCKVSGMVTEADLHQWKTEDLLPYLDIIFDAFGPQRLMYGSDWPVCLIAASYKQWVSLLESYTDKNLTARQRLDFWRENAIRFYNL
jgi:L-fuconolactonase